MIIKNIFKNINVKKFKSVFVESTFKFFEFLRKSKAKRYFVFLLTGLFIVLTIFFVVFKNFNIESVENEQIIENIKEDQIVESVEEVYSPSKEELKKEEIEKRSEEETVYGVLGDFWIEINTNDLEIKAPIVEGTTKDKLDEGVGHHVTTSFPNREKGNVVLSGHRWFPGDIPARTVFIDLDKLKVDDQVKLYYENEEFIYKITGTKIIEDTETSILNQTEKPTITIYTCTPKYPLTTPTERLVYFGELIN